MLHRVNMALSQLSQMVLFVISNGYLCYSFPLKLYLNLGGLNERWKENSQTRGKSAWRVNTLQELNGTRQLPIHTHTHIWSFVKLTVSGVRVVAARGVFSPLLFALHLSGGCQAGRRRGRKKRDREENDE